MRVPYLILVLTLCSLPAVTFLHPTALAQTRQATASSSVTESGLTSGERAVLRRALKAAKRKRWKRAHQLAAKVADPLPAKILRWHRYSGNGRASDFAALAGFIESNPDWPRRKGLLRQAERAINVRVGDGEIVAWFTKHPPISTEGRQQLAAALMRRGQAKEAVQWLRHIWIEDNLSRKESRRFYARYKRHLRKRDHRARLDRLLWDGRRGAARRMLALMPRGQRYLAEARIALMVRSPDVNARIARVPRKLVDDPGLVYERVRWRRRKDKHESAQALLATLPGDPGPRPKKWWVERRIQVRKLLGKGEAGKAYRLTSAHGQKPGSAAYAEAEWLAGWIALRFLDDKPAAAVHFRQLYEAVKYPVSRARGAYWRARVSTAMARPEHATRWYRIAADYPTTYYGQLASEALDADAKLDLRPVPAPGPDEWVRFNRREVVKAALILGELEAWDLFRSFVLNLAKKAERPAERMMIAALATRFKRYDLAVRVAKIAKRASQRLVEYGYPVFRLPKSRIESALVFALMRQESEFSATAISPAGARGLMQLMPATARQMARSLRLRYSRRRLLRDPDYNARLGTAYVARMLKEFKGSYPLAIAAYNAGPRRAGAWIREYGDPRDGDVDAIDWVESIPFTETRNYVQRVLEGVQVYRQRLAGAPVKSRLRQDLVRHTKTP
jgi:soluble lytic murein transglycosylase